MPLYDLMLLLDPQAPDERRSEIVGNVRTMIESGGSLVGEHDWGERRMTFEIDHRPEAEYRLFQFEGETELLEQLAHNLKIADGVLRFRTIKLKPGSPPPPEPRPDHGELREARGRQDGPETVAPRAAADAPPPEPEPDPEAAVAAEPAPAYEEE